jgi:hypothetical protein
MARIGIPYGRFSGKRQEAGDSERRQDDLAEQAAREEGVELDLSVTLRDRGLSAFRGENWTRGDLGKFIDLVDAGVIPAGTILIVEQVNRVSRAPWMRQVEQWKEILSRGIVIRTCVPPARYTRENMDDLAVGCPVVIYMMLGHLESKQKSQWVREAWGQKKKQAAESLTPHGRDCPGWLRPVCDPHPKDARRLVTTGYDVIPERVAVVRQVFAWAAEGWGAWSILGELVRTNAPAWGKRKQGRPPRWTRSYVRALLGCRQVLGEYQPTTVGEDGRRSPCGPPVPGFYPAVISEDAWRAAQAGRRARRKKKTGGRPGADGMDVNLFTGLLHEATSRRGLHVVNSTVNGESYRYLMTEPRVDRVPYQPFEDAVLDTLARLKPSDVDGRHEADELTALVDRLQDERARMGVDLEDRYRELEELPRERRRPRILAAIADLEDAVEAKDEELRAAKEAANTSGRTQALTEVQTCVELLREVKGTDREAGVRRRIKTRLPLLLESIWVRVQRFSKGSRYLHVRLYLHGGAERYVLKHVGRGEPSGRPWKLDGADFRAGDVGDRVVDAEPSPL